MVMMQFLLLLIVSLDFVVLFHVSPLVLHLMWQHYYFSIGFVYMECLVKLYLTVTLDFSLVFGSP